MFVTLLVLALVAVVLTSWGTRRLAAKAQESLLAGALVGLFRLVWWVLKLTVLLWFAAIRLFAGEVRTW